MDGWMEGGREGGKEAGREGGREGEPMQLPTHAHTRMPPARERNIVHYGKERPLASVIDRGDDSPLLVSKETYY